METIHERTDVLVVGGGTAGVVAALQSARAGAATTIVEMTGQLGGTMTNGGVSGIAHFFCPTHQVIAGIGWELVRKTLDLDGSRLPDVAHPPPHRPQHHIGVNRHLFAALAEEACLSAGVTPHYHELAVAAEPTESGWRIETVGKNLRRTIQAREVIDCTGDADVVGLAGLERLRGEVRQPGTLIFYLEGYDADALDAQEIQLRYQAAMASGDLQPGDYWLTNQPFVGFLRAHGRNSQHIFGADSSTSDTQTKANLAGRSSLLRLLRFVRTLPGCAEARLAWSCADVAARETYQIVGEYTVSEHDYLGGRVFDDAVGHSFYFIDVHTEGGVEHKFLAPGVVPTIPLRAMVPRGSRRLLAAGRCISADRRAFSAMRVEASCMAMGQGAGAAAALGVRLGVPSRDVPIDALRRLLREHGAILPQGPA